jgi:alkylation response protein AidB-like acyl-CoA dehydrogenase
MALRLESARLLLYRACWLRDRGEEAGLAVALAKLAVSEAALASGIDAIRIHGGLGVMSESGIERDLHDAIPSTIFSGTSDMQRTLIAAALGL